MAQDVILHHGTVVGGGGGGGYISGVGGGPRPPYMRMRQVSPGQFVQEYSWDNVVFFKEPNIPKDPYRTVVTLQGGQFDRSQIKELIHSLSYGEGKTAFVNAYTKGGKMPKGKVAPSPVRTFSAVTIERVNNGYVVYSNVNPRSGPTCGGDMYVFQTQTALHKWLGKHCPQPK